MIILGIHRIDNHITIGIVGVKEDVSMDQIIKIVKIKVDSPYEENQPDNTYDYSLMQKGRSFNTLNVPLTSHQEILGTFTTC